MMRKLFLCCVFITTSVGICSAQDSHEMFLKSASVLKQADWNWSMMPGSHVEVGGATLDVFNSTQAISIVRFPVKKHSVSVVESAGPSAMVTSEFARRNNALAALNGSYFDRKCFPTTYVKDDGRVTSARIADGVTRSNAMFRIKGKKGRTVDIVPAVDSSSTVNAAKGWREALLSGPILVDEGKIVDYVNDPQRAHKKFYTSRHPRTVLGYTSDGWIYFIVVDGRFSSKADGMSIFELQVLCEALGLYEALNLDGGGSSTLWTKEHGVVNHPCDNRTFDHKGERIVPNVLVVK